MGAVTGQHEDLDALVTSAILRPTMRSAPAPCRASLRSCVLRASASYEEVGLGAFAADVESRSASLVVM